MAVNGNFFTLNGIATIAQEGQAELLHLVQSESTIQFRQKLIQDVLNKLDYLIGLFKNAEAAMLAELNVSSLDELENRLKNFYKDSGYTQFVNVDTAKILKANFGAATDKQKAAQREEYIQILENLFTEALQDISNEIVGDPAFNEGARKAVLTRVSQLLKLYGFDGHLASTGSGKGGLTISSKIMKWDDKGDLNFFPELASSIVIARIEKMKRRAAGLASNRNRNMRYTKEQQEQLQRITNITKGKRKVTQNSASINIGMTIGNITGGMKETEAALLDKQELTRNNELIREAIVGQLSSKYQDTARKIINKMLGQKDTMFYVGTSAAQLKGILGEIGAMHAVANLLGLSEPSDEIIQWVATNTSGGKQLSIDIVLQHFANIKIKNKDIEASLGIQVKNVESNSISFVDASMDLIMSKLNINTKHLEDVFFSDDFNVGYEYNLETQQFVPMFSWKTRLTDAESFLIIESMIDEVVADIYNYLNLYAAEFLYMGLGDEFISTLATLSNELSDLSGNVLYIVRDKPFFASNMLIRIRQSVQHSVDQINSGPLKIQAYVDKLDDDNGEFNIISYLNRKGTNNAQHIHEHNVKLKSSYLFK